MKFVDFLSRAVLLGAVGGLGLLVVSCVKSQQESAGAIARSKELIQPHELARQINPEIKGWRYEMEKDEMRGVSTRIARLQAENYSTLLTPTLVVWKREGGGKGVQLDGPMVVDGISPSCDYRSRTVAVKIDNGPVQNLGCQNGMSVGIDSRLVKMLEGSDRMMLEADTNYGRKQYTFITAGLRL